jgi:hypothetical protein
MYALTRILELDNWQTIWLESETILDDNGKEIPDRIDFKIDNLVIQVKHSGSQIGLAQIKEWCNKIKDKNPDSEKELVVLGTFPSTIPPSFNDVKITRIGSDDPLVIQNNLAITLQKYVERILK